LSINNINI